MKQKKGQKNIPIIDLTKKSKKDIAECLLIIKKLVSKKKIQVKLKKIKQI